MTTEIVKLKSVFWEMASCASGQCSIFVSNDDTSNFICTFPWDRSLEAKRYQDFHQIFSHRHFYWTKSDTLFVKKIVFCRFWSVLLRIISIFCIHSLFHPLECWKTQKTASNLVSYSLCTEQKSTITQILSLKKPTLGGSVYRLFDWNAFRWEWNIDSTYW